MTVGANGEQLMDELSTITIDAQLAGGKRAAALSKELVSFVASAATLGIYRMVSSEPQPKPSSTSSAKADAGLQCSAVVLIVWGLFQAARFSLTDVLSRSEDGAGLAALIAALVLLDKLTGSAAEDAFGWIQNRMLSACSESRTTRWAVSSDVAGSYAEVAAKLTKAYAKRSLQDDGGFLAQHVGSCMAASVLFSVIAHIFMATTAGVRCPNLRNKDE